jgi:hypothetical protein
VFVLDRYGIVTYLAGAKARHEERERWQRDWDRRQRLAALARAREERESRRCEFLKRFVALSTEADELKSFLARLRERVLACPSVELARMTERTEARLQRLEGELTPERIATALQERELFLRPFITQWDGPRLGSTPPPVRSGLTLKLTFAQQLGSSTSD